MGYGEAGLSKLLAEPEVAATQEVCLSWGDPHDPYNSDAADARKRGWLNVGGYLTPAGAAKLKRLGDVRRSLRVDHITYTKEKVGKKYPEQAQHKEATPTKEFSRPRRVIRALLDKLGFKQQFRWDRLEPGGERYAVILWFGKNGGRTEIKFEGTVAELSDKIEKHFAVAARRA